MKETVAANESFSSTEYLNNSISLIEKNGTLSAVLNTPEAVTIGVFVGLLSLVTAIGNIFVITAVVRDRTLHTLPNRLVASLATTDLMVGLVVLPLASVMPITHTWPLGRDMCDIFITLDVLCCTASIYHLVAIAVDRYWTVTDLAYIQGDRKRRYFLPVSVIGIWLGSAAICLPPFFGWKTKRDGHSCMISQDQGYTIYSTLGAFYLPLIAVLIIYFKIFKVVKSTIRKESTVRHVSRSITDDTITVSTNHECLLSKSPTLNTVLSEKPYLLDNTTAEDTSNGTEHGSVDIDDSNPNIGITALVKIAVLVKNNSPGTKKSKSRQQKLAQKRERRALRTLIIITGVFITCWLPFFIFALVTPFCEQCQSLSFKTAFDFFTWLGYFNSMLNPIIYTIFSPDFRAAFRKLLSTHYSPVRH